MRDALMWLSGYAACGAASVAITGDDLFSVCFLAFAAVSALALSRIAATQAAR